MHLHLRHSPQTASAEFTRLGAAAESLQGLLRIGRCQAGFPWACEACFRTCAAAGGAANFSVPGPGTCVKEPSLREGSLRWLRDEAGALTGLFGGAALLFLKTTEPFLKITEPFLKITKPFLKIRTFSQSDFKISSWNFTTRPLHPLPLSRMGSALRQWRSWPKNGRGRCA